MATDRRDAFDDQKDRLFEVLDDLAGVPADRTMPDPDKTEPAPLSAGLAERALRDLHRRRAGGAGGTASAGPPAPRWWRRPAAVWPFGIAVLLAATLPFVNWSGRNAATELAYEDAFDMIDAPGLQPESRASAMGRVDDDLNHGITSLQKCTEHEPLRQAAEAALVRLRDLAKGPVPVRTRLPRGSMLTVLVALRDPKAEVSRRRQAIADFVVMAEEAFLLLHAATARIDLVGEMAPRALAALRARLE